jgi:NADH-quinone oxidoreductase subunit E
MGYLFFQTLLWILLAFSLGIFLGWLLRGVICGPSKDEKLSSTASGKAIGSATAAAKAPAPTNTKIKADEAVKLSDDMKPQSLSGPKGGVADDLKRIRGIGAVIEKKLNGFGIYHFAQISGLSKDNITWVNTSIAFPGRIDRDKWISQARDLAKGKV